MRRSFLPPNFQIPKAPKTGKFRLRMLTINEMVKDYEAVMTSVNHLRGVLGPRAPKWPAPMDKKGVAVLKGSLSRSRDRLENLGIT